LTSGATIEVTLQTNKSQATNEIPAISRHLADIKKRDKCNDYFTIFVAKALHPDSIFMSEFAYARDNQLISTYGINDFANKMAKSSQVIDLKKIPKRIFKEIKSETWKAKNINHLHFLKSKKFHKKRELRNAAREAFNSSV